MSYTNCNPIITSTSLMMYEVNKWRVRIEPDTIITIDDGFGGSLVGGAAASTMPANEFGSGGSQSSGVAFEEYKLAEFVGSNPPGGTTSLAIDDNYQVSTTSLLSNNVQINDTNDGAQDLVTYLTELPTNAQEFHLYRDGTFTYQAWEGFDGLDTFQYQNFDGTGWTFLATVTIEVLPF